MQNTKFVRSDNESKFLGVVIEKAHSIVLLHSSGVVEINMRHCQTENSSLGSIPLPYGYGAQLFSDELLFDVKPYQKLVGCCM